MAARKPISEEAMKVPHKLEKLADLFGFKVRVEATVKLKLSTSLAPGSSVKGDTFVAAFWHKEGENLFFRVPGTAARGPSQQAAVNALCDRFSVLFKDYLSDEWEFS